MYVARLTRRFSTAHGASASASTIVSASRSSISHLALRRPLPTTLDTAHRRGMFDPAAFPGSGGANGTVRGYVSSSINAEGEPEVILDRAGAEGGVATLCLNKPERLNALSLSMIRDMSEAIAEAFPTVNREGVIVPSNGKGARLLVLRGSGGKAFCAGGDVKAVATDKSLGPGVTGTLRSDFFREEYRLDYRLAQIAKEKALLSLWDGVVMGGGVGISVHGSFRVATETTLFAMPETVIGLFPDVGSAYVLSRLPGGLGQYLGLAGTRLRAADLLHCGLATHLVPRERLAELQQALSDDSGGDPAAILQAFATAELPEQSSLVQERPWIDGAFCGAASVEEIFERLEARATDCDDVSAQEWAQATLNSLRKASPTSLKVTHRHIAWAAHNDLKQCFEQDFRVVQHLMTKSDFAEGVRARLVDKDNKPVWHPSTLKAVSDSYVQELFDGIGEHELDMTSTHD